MTNKIVIRKPDDMHSHLRDGEMLELVVDHTARNFARAIIMPNLVPPVVNAVQAGEYYNIRLPIEADAQVGDNWAEVH